MTIYRCDRCKDILEQPYLKLERKEARIENTVRYDLCEQCYKDFLLFIHGNATKEVDLSKKEK